MHTYAITLIHTRDNSVHTVTGSHPCKYTDTQFYPLSCWLCLPRGTEPLFNVFNLSQFFLSAYLFAYLFTFPHLLPLGCCHGPGDLPVPLPLIHLYFRVWGHVQLLVICTRSGLHQRFNILDWTKSHQQGQSSADSAAHNAIDQAGTSGYFAKCQSCTPFFWGGVENTGLHLTYFG